MRERGQGQGHRGADVLPVKARPRVGLHSLAAAVAVAGAAVAAAAACRLVAGFDLYVR